jgi:hypothetical protein
MPRGNGGIIGPVNTSFSGVWSLTEAQLRRSANTWPNFYAALLSESATGSDAVTGAEAVDPYFEYTTLLLPGNGPNLKNNNEFLDSSANAFTITRNPLTGPNAPTQGTFSPFSQTGWGNYFGGSPSVLSGSGQLLGVVSNNFTVEAWVFIPTFSGVNNYPILGTSTTSTSPTGIYFAVKPDGNLVAAETWGTNVYTSTGITATAGTWNHVAVCRSGSTVRLFLNGVAASNTGTFSAGYNSTSFVIGRTWTTDAANSSYMIGTISNLRVISGQALYSGNFTPSTSPLTSTTVGSTGAGAATSITGTVTLLTCQDNRFKDNSPSNRTITATGSPTVVAFSPFNPTASWSAATYGGSGYFDGSGDYLTVPAQTALSFAGDFTIETWIYITSNLSTNYGLLDARASAGTLAAWAWDLFNSSGTKLDFIYGAARLTSASTVPTNQWVHLVVSRVGSTIRQFINGTVDANTATTSAAVNANRTDIYIGNLLDASTALPGYMSGIRVVNGSGVTSVTVPTSPPTAITNTSLLLNFTNAGIYDATSKNDLETVGDAQISNTTAQFGATSIKFDPATGAAADYLQAPTSNLFDMGTGDYTFEAWVYVTSLASINRLFSSSNAGFSSGYFIAINTSGFVTVETNSPSYQQLASTNNAITANNWTHVAITKASGTVRVFVNGNSCTTSGSQTNSFNTGGNALQVGGSIYTASYGYFKGYIQDARITKGYARYTANFTPPTAAFPTL